MEFRALPKPTNPVRHASKGPTSVQRFHRRVTWQPDGPRVSARRGRLRACLYPAGRSRL